MKHNRDQPLHAYFPSASVGTIHLDESVKDQEFSPFFRENMDDQSTKIQVILIPSKGSRTRGI